MVYNSIQTCWRNSSSCSNWHRRSSCAPKGRPFDFPSHPSLTFSTVFVIVVWCCQHISNNSCLFSSVVLNPRVLMSISNSVWLRSCTIAMSLWVESQYWILRFQSARCRMPLTAVNPIPSTPYSQSCSINPGDVRLILLVFPWCLSIQHSLFFASDIQNGPVVSFREHKRLSTSRFENARKLSKESFLFNDHCVLHRWCLSTESSLHAVLIETTRLLLDMTGAVVKQDHMLIFGRHYHEDIRCVLLNCSTILLYAQ